MLRMITPFTPARPVLSASPRQADKLGTQLYRPPFRCFLPPHLYPLKPTSPHFIMLLALLMLLHFCTCATQAQQTQYDRSQTPLDMSATADALVMGYYPSWAAPAFPPEKIDFERFDWIDFAFAFPDQNFALTFDDPIETPALLDRLVISAHAQGTKVKLSIGGWSNSQYFSPAVATNSSRDAFVLNILTVYNQFNLDGIDIDWEYPGQAGDGSNEFDSDDTANLLLFFRLLRNALPPGAKITSATQTTPFVGADGKALKDVSGLASVLDWILVMNYDTWGASRTPGPNAPFYDACHNSSQPTANAVAAYNAWTSAGLGPFQIVLGVPSYGYVSNSNATVLQTRSQSSLPRQSPIDIGTPTPNVTLTPESDSSIQFSDLVLQGALVLDDTTGLYVGGGGFSRFWDECSSTPFLRSEDATQVVPYDDTESLGMKAQFAKRAGMRGVNIFDVHGDTDKWVLVDAIRAGLGLLS